MASLTTQESSGMENTVKLCYTHLLCVRHSARDITVNKIDLIPALGRKGWENEGCPGFLGYLVKEELLSVFHLPLARQFLLLYKIKVMIFIRKQQTPLHASHNMHHSIIEAIKKVTKVIFNLVMLF